MKIEVFKRLLGDIFQYFNVEPLFDLENDNQIQVLFSQFEKNNLLFFYNLTKTHNIPLSIQEIDKTLSNYENKIFTIAKIYPETNTIERLNNICKILIVDTMTEITLNIIPSNNMKIILSEQLKQEFQLKNNILTIEEVIYDTKTETYVAYAKL